MMPDQSQPFHIETDASKYATGHQRNRKVETFQGGLEKQVQMWPGICLAIPCIGHSAQHKVDYDQTGGLSP